MSDTSNIQIGDIVACIRDASFFTVGHEYEVIGICVNGCHVELIDDDGDDGSMGIEYVKLKPRRFENGERL